MKNIIIISILIIFLSGCSFTYYYSHSEYTSEDFQLKQNDTIGIYNVFFTDTHIVSQTTNYIEEAVISDKKLFCIRNDSINLILKENRIYGQPIIWDSDFIELLSNTFNFRNILRGIILKCIDNNVQKGDGSEISLQLELYDLKLKKPTWSYELTGTQIIPTESVVYSYSTVLGELADIASRIYNKELKKKIK